MLDRAEKSPAQPRAFLRVCSVCAKIIGPRDCTAAVKMLIFPPLLDEQRTGSGVPFLQTNSRNPSKRPAATHARSRAAEPSRRTLRTQREIPVIMNIRIGKAFVHRKSRHSRLVEASVLLRRGSLPVQSAPCPRRPRKVHVEGIKDHAGDYRIAFANPMEPETGIT